MKHATEKKESMPKSMPNMPRKEETERKSKEAQPVKPGFQGKSGTERDVTMPSHMQPSEDVPTKTSSKGPKDKSVGAN